MTRQSTSVLMKKLFKTKNLTAFMEQNRESMTAPGFAAYINELCSSRGLVPERVIKQAQIDRTYGHQLFNGTRRPSRDKVLQLAFGFGLSVDEAQELLRAAGKCPLYPRIKRDAVVIYCLSRGEGIFEVQEALGAYGLTLLGGDWKYGD